jgi:hypothetical protein
MNDFGQHLTALLDDAAADIEPRPDFGSIRSGHVRVSHAHIGGDFATRRPFRRTVGIAAATLVVFGGSALAFEAATDGQDSVASVDVVATSTSPASETELAVDRRQETKPAASSPIEPSVTKPVRAEPIKTGPIKTGPSMTEPPKVNSYAANLGTADLGGSPMRQNLFGIAGSGETVTVTTTYGSATSIANDGGEWALTLVLNDVPGGTKVLARVTFSGSSAFFDFRLERPLPPPPPSPAPVEFTATPGSSNLAGSPMKQVWYGTATPGTVITASSEFGSAQATANSNGKWELALKMFDVPGGTDVRVILSANTSDNVYEFMLHRPEPAPEPVPSAFTVNLGSARLGGSPMKQVFYGTGAAGSVVHAQSEFGSVEAVVSPTGQWEMRLEMHGVPSGSDVGVRLTNSASESVFEYVLHRPVSEPVAIDFTANAALSETDANPAFNEYWGKSTTGAVITISSPYGSGEVTSDADGKWAARIEFPGAPVGETFIVRITSSKGTAVYEFPLTH